MRGGDRSPASGEQHVLVISATLQGGSWRWIEEVIEAAGLGKQTRVVAYGNRRYPNRIFGSVVRIPFVSYERVGIWLSRHLLIAPLFNLPLIVAAYFAFFLFRPRVVMVNGVVLALASIPYCSISGAKCYLAFHGAHQGYSSNLPGRVQRILGRVLSRVAGAFVNSVGSERDLSGLLKRVRVVRVEHWADRIYFDQPLERERLEARLVVLYVGRIDSEKTAFLLRVVEACRDDPIVFRFVGGGMNEGAVSRLAARHPDRVRHHGYESDKAILASYFLEADVVWGAADDTYLAKPAVEALAAGVPIIVPDIPAVAARAEAGVRVPSDLVPECAGWVIDGRDVAAARALLLKLAVNKPDYRGSCRAVALDRYSPRNVAALAALLREIGEQE